MAAGRKITHLTHSLPPASLARRRTPPAQPLTPHPSPLTRLLPLSDPTSLNDPNATMRSRGSQEIKEDVARTVWPDAIAPQKLVVSTTG